MLHNFRYNFLTLKKTEKQLFRDATLLNEIFHFYNIRQGLFNPVTIKPVEDNHSRDQSKLVLSDGWLS